jgi:hypothetical protein
MKIDLNSKIDLVDQYTRYMDLLEKYDANTFKERNSKLHLIPAILERLVLPDGYIIEAGVWKGDLYKIFQNYYGKDRCIGFDIEQYINDTSIIYGDFRLIKNKHKYQCSLFVNGLGTWKNNKSSKQAGVDYANENLMLGGYYFDTHYLFEPEIEKTKNFEYIEINQLFVVYKKIKND